MPERADERFTCPRRAETPLCHEHDQDGWSNGGRWIDFPWSWTPRTCSFCGSVHPEDALRLLAEGWEDEMTTKRYKGYLHPPGHRQSIAVGMRKMREEGIKGFSKRPSVSSPTPPAKFYTMHFSPEQIAKLNAAHSGRGQ